MIHLVTHAAVFLAMTSMATLVSGEAPGWENDASVIEVTSRVSGGNEEESERLKELFEKLKVEPHPQADYRPADLPDLYRPDPDQEGEFIRRDNHFLIDFNPRAETKSDREMIWIVFQANESRFYVVHRLKRNDPHHDRIFGPYEGNPYELLPELEERLREGLRTKDSNALIRMRRMAAQRNQDLAARVAKLIEFGLALELEMSEKNRLVQSLSQIVENYAETFADEALAAQVASIKESIRKFEQEIDALTLEFPAEKYIVIEKAHQFEMPESIDESMWGDPVDGLRFAVVPESTTLKFEDVVKVTLVVENVGDEDIKFCVHDLVQDVRPDITFKGKRVYTQTTWFSGWPPTNRYRLKPGDVISLAESSLVAFQSSRPETANTGFGVTSIPVKALQFKESMQVSYTMRIGSGEAWMRCDDGVMRVYSPAKGEWKGTLTSAEFDIEFRR